MQTIDPIVSPMTLVDQLRVKIPQRNTITPVGAASPNVHPPTTALPTSPLPLDSAGNKSNNSSSTEMSHPSPTPAGGDTSPTALDTTFNTSQQQQPHHLLKHQLRPENAQALSHFDANNDVKEASREISRMGQRDLQAKFKLVYGTQTHSNNNEWLRRKLYEAIGALPVKMNANKSKGRRHHGAVAHQLPKVRITTASPITTTATMTGPATTINGSADRQLQHGASSPGGKRGLRRSPASTPRKLIAMELKRRMSLVPSSPRFYASSVLDAHRNISDETDSDDDDKNGGGGGGFELDEERQDESTLGGVGNGQGGLTVPRTAAAAAAASGGGLLRSFTRMSSQQNNSSTVVGTFLAQDVAYYTPPNPPHQAVVVTGGGSSGAGASTTKRVSRSGLSRVHPTYWQQQRQQQQQQQPLSRVGSMPRSSSTTQLLKSMDLDLLGDREWPDALCFNHDWFSLASMPDEDLYDDADEEQQQQIQVENGGNAAAASGVMDCYYN